MNRKYSFVRNYFIKLIVSLIIATLSVFLLLLLAYYLFGNVFYTQIYESAIYGLMLKLRDNIVLIIIFTLLISYTIIILVYMRGLSRYINEIMDNTNAIYDSSKQIRFSKELNEVALEFNRIKNDIEYNKAVASEAVQRKNDLIVYLAHDLKTPLTSVIGYLTLLNDEKNLPSEIKEKYISIAKEKSLRLEDLLNEFFEITRFNLSTIELDLKTIDISLMLEQMTFEFIPVYQQKEIECKVEIDSEVMIHGDINKLQRAIDNLLMNAYYYSYPNSTVTIKLKKSSDKAVLTIINEGDTIPSEKLDRLFDQFYRGDSSRNSYNGGSGLGLAITKEILEAHNGSVAVSSFDNKIIFSIELNLM